MTLEERVAAIPGDNGWWHSSNGATYLRLARLLRDSGVSEDLAVRVLTDAYFAAASEFGA